MAVEDGAGDVDDEAVVISETNDDEGGGWTSVIARAGKGTWKKRSDVVHGVRGQVRLTTVHRKGP